MNTALLSGEIARYNGFDAHYDQLLIVTRTARILHNEPNVQVAIEIAGVVDLDENRGGTGVQLRKAAQFRAA